MGCGPSADRLRPLDSAAGASRPPKAPVTRRMLPQDLWGPANPFHATTVKRLSLKPCHRPSKRLPAPGDEKGDEDPEEADPNAIREPRVGVLMKMDWLSHERGSDEAQGLWEILERVLQRLRSVGFYDSPDPGR
jgi:hypothetical protein